MLLDLSHAGTLGFRHYPGLPCHLADCTQAVPWPTQGPSLYTGAKVSSDSSEEADGSLTPSLSFLSSISLPLPPSLFFPPLLSFSHSLFPFHSL